MTRSNPRPGQLPPESAPDTDQNTAGPRRRAWRWAGRLGGVVFGVLLAWLLLEVMLRALFFSLPPRIQLVLQEVRVTPFTERTLLPAPIWQPDRDFLTITRPVQDRTQYGTAEVQFNVSTKTLWGSHLAFRTRQDLVDRYVDAVAVGDSFTFCFNTLDDCWVTRLAQQTDRNVINLGITSTGALSHLRVLEGFGLPLEPPLVIWQWFGNDANEDFGHARLRGETDLESPNPAPPAPERTWWDRHSAVYVLLKLYLGDDTEFDASLQFLDRERVTEGDLDLMVGRPYLWEAFDMSQPHNQYGWERGQAALRTAQQQVSAYGGTLLVILMPTKEQVYRPLTEPVLGAHKLALLDESRQLMLDFCADAELTCLDLLPIFQGEAAGEPLYYTTDIHLTAHGNAVLADALAEWIAAHPDVFAEAP